MLGLTWKEELRATQGRRGPEMESTLPQMEVVMETLIGKQATGFWKLTEASLDGKGEGGKDEALQ